MKFFKNFVEFAVENSFITDLENLPDSALKFLDYEAIGQQQMDNDEGSRYGRYLGFSMGNSWLVFDQRDDMV